MFTYNDALKYLDAFTDYEKIGLPSPGSPEAEQNFDLDKLRRVLKKLGSPQDAYRIIHVAGTKGKGSVCTYVSSILESSGYRVGLFTSPHLVSPTERIKINAVDITEDDIVRVVKHLRSALGAGAETQFSFFEIYTLMAILYFGMEKVDFAVLETGMGGRLDATNALDAGVCCITPVSYDHVCVLGPGIERIAREKAAIIKRNARCIVSVQKENVLKIIREKCVSENAPILLAGKDITWSRVRLGENGSRFNIRTGNRFYGDCQTSMPGDFQVENCATAVGVCEEALGGEKVNEEAFRNGIERAFIPGRMEILCRQPLVVIDGAQNSDSAVRLKNSVEKIFRYDRLILLLGVSRDKDIEGICRALAPLADEIVLTRAATCRAMDPSIIRGYVKGKRVRVTESVKEAFGAALARARKNDMILATGSFFVIGELRAAILGRRVRNNEEHEAKITKTLFVKSK